MKYTLMIGFFLNIFCAARGADIKLIVLNEYGHPVRDAIAVVEYSTLPNEVIIRSSGVGEDGSYTFSIDSKENLSIVGYASNDQWISESITFSAGVSTPVVLKLNVKRDAVSSQSSLPSPVEAMELAGGAKENVSSSQTVTRLGERQIRLIQKGVVSSAPIKVTLDGFRNRIIARKGAEDSGSSDLVMFLNGSSERESVEIEEEQGMVRKKSGVFWVKNPIAESKRINVFQYFPYGPFDAPEKIIENEYGDGSRLEYRGNIVTGKVRRGNYFVQVAVFNSKQSDGEVRAEIKREMEQLLINLPGN